MRKGEQKIILGFRYLGYMAALGLLIYIGWQNSARPKVLTYRADWSRPLTANTRGWYPQSRVYWQDNLLYLRSEPLYWQMYSQAEYRQLTISGSVATSSEAMRIGLRQSDGTWQWQELTLPQFSLQFNLDKAARRRNQLELILSVPTLQPSSQVALNNDWQFILNR